jgi:hypothetical protein
MEFKLHYTGKGLYGKERFIEEARRLGVSRSVPARMLSKVKWGDPILLAEYEPSDAGRFKDGKALGFGYFAVNGLSLANVPDGLRDKLLKRLDVVDGEAVGATVRRRCGSYIVGSQYVVNDSLGELIAAIRKLSKQEQEKVKVFVNGEFSELEFELQPINFCRTLVTVDLDLDPDMIIRGTGEVKLAFLYDYERRHYVRKSEDAVDA